VLGRKVCIAGHKKWVTNITNKNQRKVLFKLGKESNDIFEILNQVHAEGVKASCQELM
jgi:hypothetical protein